MKYSLCTIALRNEPVSEVFDLMNEYGYRHADIHAVHLPLSTPPKKVDELLKLAQARGISIVSLASLVGEGLSSPEQAKRKEAVREINQCIDLAARVGATVIRTAMGGLTHFDDRMKELVIPALLEAVNYAEKRNIRLGVENHSGDIAQTVENCQLACEAIPSEYFGIIYDPGNLLGLLEDYKALLRLMPGRIVHVHMKDGFPAKFNDDCAPQRLSCTAFGKGKLDIPFILRELDRTGYRGYVSVEYEAWHPEYNLPPVETGLKHCLDYLKNIG